MTESLVVQSVKNLPVMEETEVWSLDQEDPLEKEMAVFLRGESHGQRSLVGYSPWGLKELTRQPLNHLHCIMKQRVKYGNNKKE